MNSDRWTPDYAAREMERSELHGAAWHKLSRHERLGVIARYPRGRTPHRWVNLYVEWVSGIRHTPPRRGRGLLLLVVGVVVVIWRVW
jgi:hypothetical protein